MSKQSHVDKQTRFPKNHTDSICQLAGFDHGSAILLVHEGLEITLVDWERGIIVHCEEIDLASLNAFGLQVPHRLRSFGFRGAPRGDKISIHPSGHLAQLRSPLRAWPHPFLTNLSASHKHLFSTHDHGQLSSNKAGFYHTPSPYVDLTVH